MKENEWFDKKYNKNMKAIACLFLFISKPWYLDIYQYSSISYSDCEIW